MSTDPYAALGLGKTATQDEIKKAYRKIAKEAHPDLNPGDTKAEGRFKAAAAAYDLLKDPETRAKFDRGEIDAAGQERAQRSYYREYAEAPNSGYRTSRGFDDMGGFGGVFDDLFRQRGAGGRGQAAKGQDMHFNLEVGFMEAALGGTRRLTLPGGNAIDVKIPQGLADGQTIRLRGKGHKGIGGGPDGDALVTVGVAEHPFFRREGEDILVDLPISLDEAVLGGKVQVPTIDGAVALTIPAGANTGQVLRLRGRGITRGTKKGDQRVSLRVVMPEKIDTALSDFMKSWKQNNAYNPRRGME